MQSEHALDMEGTQAFGLSNTTIPTISAAMANMRCTMPGAVMGSLDSQAGEVGGYVLHDLRNHLRWQVVAHAVVNDEA